MIETKELLGSKKLQETLNKRKVNNSKEVFEYLTSIWIDPNFKQELSNMFVSINASTDEILSVEPRISEVSKSIESLKTRRLHRFKEVAKNAA